MKGKDIFFSILLSSLLLVIASCHRSSVPNGILSEEQMVDLMMDVYLLEGYYAEESSYQYDSVSTYVSESYDELCSKYGISQQGLDSNIAYYLRDPKVYEAIHQKVLGRIEQKLEEK